MSREKELVDLLLEVILRVRALEKHVVQVSSSLDGASPDWISRRLAEVDVLYDQLIQRALRLKVIR